LCFCNAFLIDTHFKYENDQCKKAILGGELKLRNSLEFYEALIYNSGMTASSAFLLKENPESISVFDECNKFHRARTPEERKAQINYKQTRDVTKIHDITWNQEGTKTVEWRAFTNLDNEHKQDFDQRKMNVWPKQDVLMKTGTLLRSHYSTSDPIFLPYKGSLSDIGADSETLYEPPPPDCFAGRLYETTMRLHSLGVTATGNPTIGVTEESVFKNLIQRVKELSVANNAAFPPELRLYWACKTQRSHMKVSPVVEMKLNEMYTQGMGHRNKDLRYTAEQATAELHDSVITHLWDQRLICTEVKIKSNFGNKFSKEKNKKDIAEATMADSVMNSEASQQSGLSLPENTDIEEVQEVELFQQ